MNILVTGGAGFIGSHVVDRYIDQGHTVTVIDNLASGDRRNLHPGAVFCEADIRDAEAVDRLFAEGQFEILNHHAAQMDVRKSVDDPVYDADVNILGSIRLLQGAVRNGVRKVIYISTGGAVYGEPRRLPVAEDDPVNPECPYGITKHTVEHYLYYLRHLNGLDYTVLRYPNVYGPRQNAHGEAGVVAIFCGLMLEGRTPVLYGDGTPERDYVYVGDIAEANELALEKAGGEIINLGSGRGTSVRELYDALSEILGYAGTPELAPLRPGEIQRICLASEKAAQVLGWTASTSLREGMAQTAGWARRVHADGSWR